MATKIWASTVEEGRAQYAAQQRFFGRIEIEQIHNLTAWRDQLSWLREEREAGRIDRLGVTHYSARHFGELEQALQTGLFDTVQVPLNLRERECERRILPLAEELGVAVIVMRPLGGTGAPLLRARTGPCAPGAAAALRGRDVGAGAAQWCLADPRVDLVIPATSRPERAVENAAAGSPPVLGPEERRLVEQLAGG